MGSSDDSDASQSKALDSSESESLPTRTVKSWARYRGPMGGTGWVNTVSGEVRYQDKNPEGDEYDGFDPSVERQANSNVKRASPEAVAETAAPIVDTTPQELIDATYRETGGIMGSTYVAQMAMEQVARENATDTYNERFSELLGAFADIDVDYESERETTDVD